MLKKVAEYKNENFFTFSSEYLFTLEEKTEIDDPNETVVSTSIRMRSLNQLEDLVEVQFSDTNIFLDFSFYFNKTLFFMTYLKMENMVGKQEEYYSYNITMVEFVNGNDLPIL